MKLTKDQYICLFTTLWKKIVLVECEGKVPPNTRDADYSELVFTKTKIDGMKINEYLQQYPHKCDIVPRYFYRRYYDAKKGVPEIRIDDEVLYNVMYYLGYRLPHIVDYKKYHVDNLKLLFNKFKADHPKIFPPGDNTTGTAFPQPTKPNDITNLLVVIEEYFEKPKIKEKLGSLMEFIRFEDDSLDLIRNLKFIRNTYCNPNINYLQLGSLHSHYELIHDFRKYPVDGWGQYQLNGAFELDPILKKFQAQAVKDNKPSLTKGNLPIIRVKDLIRSDTSLNFVVQTAEYYDQVASNMRADRKYPPSSFPGANDHICTIRQWDMYQASVKNMPPPFSRSKLSNTIGVAVAMIAKNEDGQRVFLTRKRTAKDDVMTYRDTLHLPFSFALKIENLEKLPSTGTIKDIIRPSYEKEHIAELGFVDKNFDRLKPVAFCRELIRAGKPQFFFELEMLESVEELKAKIAENSHGNESNIVFEYEPDSLDGGLGFDKFTDSNVELEKALNFFKEKKISSELFASMLLTIDHLPHS